MSRSVDVLCVGGGLAGCAAIAECLRRDAGVQCVLIEAAPALGGNSCKASSGINVVAPTSGDSVDLLVRDTLVSGGDLCDAEKVVALANDSESAYRFLKDVTGVDMSLCVRLGGHSCARTRRPSSGPNVGFAIMRPLMQHVLECSRVQVRLQAKLTSLTLASSGQWHATWEQLGESGSCRAGAVILAAGGFGGSRSAVAAAAPDLQDLPSTNADRPYGGEVLDVARAAGADIVHVDQIQVHPTALVDPADPEAHCKILGPEALRGHGGILLDAAGSRFVNELTRRDAVTAAMQKADAPIWLALPEDAARHFGESTLAFYKGKGLFREATSLAHMASLTGMDGAKLAQAVQDYSAAATRGSADSYGKETFPAAPIDPEGPLHFAQVTPAVHYCMGGIRIDPEACVLDLGGARLPGLMAAGEVTGGVHGRNRLAGNSLLDCVVFGRRAAASACAHLTGSPCPGGTAEEALAPRAT